MRPFSRSTARVGPGRRLTLGLGKLALLWGLVTVDAYAQFNARGRSPTPSAPPKTEKQGTQNNKPTSAPLERDDVLIERYEKLVLTEPGEDVPLTRLAELVRKRDGNLKSLLSKLEKAASSGPNRYAALIAWGGMLSKDGQLEAAIIRLEEAAALNPERPSAWLLLGTLQQTLGKKAEAEQSFKKALPHLKGPERSMLVRNLRDLCLDNQNYECAAKHHQSLTQESRGNLFLQGELGRELLKRGQTEKAIEELNRVARQAAGDARALAPALRDLGEAQLEGGKIKDAIVSLKRASQLAAPSPGLRIAIDTLRAEAHRRDGSLSALLDELESSGENASRLGLLGRLLEEQGNTEKAAATYERALRLDPSQLDLRLRLVRLYEITGDIDGAVAEYGRLVKASPRDVQLSLRFAEMLLAQGKRDRAISEFDRIDRVAASDPEASLLLLDFSERLEETERKRRILSRLSQLGSRDTQFLVELGSRYYQSGDTDAAHRTWKRILDVGSDRARAHLTYGEVLIDHEKPTEGVAELRKAADLSPADLRVKKALALGLERASSQAPPATKQNLEQQALKAWTDLLRSSPQALDPTLSQTQSLARRHIVRIWKRTGKLTEALSALEKDLRKTPPDLESGRLLAEAYLAARAERQAIATLKFVLRHAPGDIATLLLLESAYAKTGDYHETVGILEKLVEADPRRAREYYDRMARTASLKNDHRNALRYAELAVQKSPKDPGAQASLGDLYATQGRLKEAEEAYRRALAQDDRLHAVSLKLAEILTKTGRSKEALEVLLHVTRSARDLEAVGLAARRAMALSIPLKKEREVEDTLRPLAISYPDQPVYRTLLLEVLSSQMYALLLSTQHGSTADREAAQAALKALSDRSLGPLLAALSARNPAEQQMAISLLSHGSSKTAGSGLLAFAEGSAPEEQRLSAILALGNLESHEFDERLRNLVSPLGTPRRGRIPRAAAWVLSRGTNHEAAQALLGALANGDLELRSYAALGLADLASKSQQRSRIIQELSLIVEGMEYGGVARSAAALALGKLATISTLKEQERQALEQMVLSAYATGSTLLQQSALISLARISRGPLARERVAQSLLSADENLRQTATFAAALLALGEEAPAVESLLPARLLPSEMDAQDRVTAALKVSRAGVTSLSRHAALVLLEQDLIDHAKVGLRSSAQEARTILQQIRSQGRQVLFGQLLTAEDLRIPSALLPQSLEAAARIRAALSDEVISLASGPHPDLADQALRTLRTDDGKAALLVLERQLKSPSTETHAAALDAATNSANSEAILLLSEYLKSETSWGRRRRTVSALGDLIQNSPSPDVAEQARTLLRSLRRDPSELVRREVLTILNHPLNDVAK